MILHPVSMVLRNHEVEKENHDWRGYQIALRKDPELWSQVWMISHFLIPSPKVLQPVPTEMVQGEENTQTSQGIMDTGSVWRWRQPGELKWLCGHPGRGETYRGQETQDGKRGGPSQIMPLVSAQWCSWRHWPQNERSKGHPHRST